MKPKFENNKHECTLSISVSIFTPAKLASFQEYCNNCLHTSNIFHFLIVQFDFQARQKNYECLVSITIKGFQSTYIYL